MEIVLEILAVFGLLIHAALLVKYWAILPETIPTHYTFSGEADGWGSKSTLIILLVVNIGMYLMFTVLHYFPHAYNYTVEITEKNTRAVLQCSVNDELYEGRNCLDVCVY